MKTQIILQKIGKQILLMCCLVLLFSSCKKDAHNSPDEDVYLAGQYQRGGEGVGYLGSACYWKNGKRQSLETPIVTDDDYNSSVANSVFVSGGDVYVGGAIYKNNFFLILQSGKMEKSYC